MPLASIEENCPGKRTRKRPHERPMSNLPNDPLKEKFRPDVDADLMKPYMGFRRMGTPDDIASMFAFVASDEARSVHGAILAVDRGVTAG